MKKLEVLDELSRHFSEVSPYKDKFDEHDYVSKRFNMFSGDECKVTLKCNIQLQEEMLDRFGKIFHLPLLTAIILKLPLPLPCLTASSLGLCSTATA